ncbi:MAG: InlB B-repeat-containing protein [Muribaculaceae bacterium]|nr:InlB B-repeat-containing protein [Muribaculaceae bacterium]
MSFKKKSVGRMLSTFLAAAVMVTSVPQSVLTVNAAETAGAEITPPQSIIATDTDTPDTELPTGNDPQEASDQGGTSDTDAGTETPAENSSADTAPDTDTPTDTTINTDTPADTATDIPTDATTDTDSSADTNTDKDIPTELTPDTDTPAADEPTTFVVNFDDNGHPDAHGDGEKPQMNKYVTAGSKLVESEMPKLIDAGFVLDGWYKDQLCTEPWDYENDTVTSDITLYAKWTAVYTITFDLYGHGITEETEKNDGKIIKENIPAGSKLIESETPIPTQAGFFFEGWYKDELWTERWDYENDTVTEDLTLYALWTKNCTVTFDFGEHGVKEGADGTPEKIGTIIKKDIHSGDLLEQTDDLKPTEDGWNFEGWYKDETFTQIWDFKKDYVIEDMTLYAKWEDVAGKFVVTFNLSGHGVNFFQYISSDTTDNKIEKPETPTAFGYLFENWYKEEACTTPWNFETDTVTADITLYAKWDERFYDVTFQSEHGTVPSQKQVKEGALIEQSADLQLTESGFSFEGWYKDAELTQKWDFEQDTVLEPTTLYAKWLTLYTVTFNLSGHGEDIIKTDIKAGSLLDPASISVPAVDGFHFEGWYKDAEFKEQWNFYTDTVQNNITLYAKWEDVAGKFVVTFDLREHGMNFYSYVKADSLVEKPEAPTDDGWIFLDWYGNEDYTEKWNFEKDKITEDTTLYAKWKEEETLQVQPIEPLTYTGKALKPTVTVYIGNEESQMLLKAGKDYKITYKNNKQSNAATAEQLKAKGDWLEDVDTLEGGSSATGERVAGGFNPLLPYVLIEGKGNYEGKLYVNFVISQVVIGGVVIDNNGNEISQEAAGITLKYNDQFATGNYKKDQKTITSLKYKAALKEGADYTASIEGEGVTTNGSLIPKDAPIFNTEDGGGTLTLTITGIGNYTGTIVKTILVGAQNHLMKNVKISLGSKCKSKVFDPTAYPEGVKLTPAWQETIEEPKEDKDGNPVEDSNGDYVMVKKTYYKQWIDGQWVTASDLDSEDPETGNLIKGKLDKNNAYTVKQGNNWLQYDVDFDVRYLNNTGTGTATMILEGKNGYIGTKSVTFKITGKAFNGNTVKIATDEDGNGWVSKMTYDGTEKTQSVTLVTKKGTTSYGCGLEAGEEEDVWDDKKDDYVTKKHKHSKDCDPTVNPDRVFTEGAEGDYTVSYKNNVNRGTATAIFTANPSSGYQGSFKKTFKIVGIDMAEFINFESTEGSIGPQYTDKTSGTDEYGDPITIPVLQGTRYLEEDFPVPYTRLGATFHNIILTHKDTNATLTLNQDYTIKYSNNKTITPDKKTLLYKEKVEDDWDEDGNVTKWHWEYEYEYSPDKAKMGVLTITGKGNYTGKLTIKYVISKGDFDNEHLQVEVARSAYNPNTASYKPKVTVKTEKDGTLSAKEYTVEYHNNKKAEVNAWWNDQNGSAPAPYVTVSVKSSSKYEDLTKDEDGEYNAPTQNADMEFYKNKLTANNLYIIIDNDNPKELVYTGSQVTNVSARVYYGAPAAVKQAKKAKVTNNRLLTAPVPENGDYSGGYGLTLLTEATEGIDGNYTVTYGKNNTVGKNKGSITITGLGEYGSSVTQKFTIYKSPVSYRVTPLAEPEE